MRRPVRAHQCRDVETLHGAREERGVIDDDILGLVLGKLDGVRQQGGYWMARCPAHEDTRASLSVGRGTSQPVVVNCHAGCDAGVILERIGLTLADISAPRERQDRAVVVAEYRYTDEAGQVLFVKERREPKDFLIKRPDGHGGWAWGLGKGRRTLYRLPQVTGAASKGEIIYVAEGERDVHALEEAGVVATTNFDGTAKPGQRAKVRPEYADVLKGADVVVVADDDEAGHAHAREWAKVLAGKARSVRLVLPAEGCKDAHDHFTAGHDLGGFRPMETAAEHTGPHLPGIPEYPVDALTGPLREIIEAGAAAGLPAALVGGAALGAVATVCGMADLQVYETWTVRPCLWVPLIAPAGGGKTPAITLARRKLRELDAKAHGIYSHALQLWFAKPPKDRGESPRDPTRLINDITIEMVARWLAAGDGTGGVDADELAEWLRGLSRYRKDGGTDVARWLGLWSTQPWRYQRVSSHIDLLVERPVISVCGGIQPHLLHLLGPEGDGMRPRWLPHMSLTTELDPRGGRKTPEWDAAIGKLYAATGARTWTMAPPTLGLWRSAQQRWKGMQRDLESPSVTAALAKADEQAARIALVIAESLDPAAGGEIPADAVTAAVAIVDYTLNVWRAMPGGEILALSRRDAELSHAVDRLAEWLERHGGKAAIGDLRRACVAGARTAGKLTEVLAEYEATYPGSVREETPEERQGKRGPAARVVFAPRRTDGQSPQKPMRVLDETVGANSFPDRCIKSDVDQSAVRSVSDPPGETAGTADDFSANGCSPTVSATQRNPYQCDFGGCKQQSARDCGDGTYCQRHAAMLGATWPEGSIGAEAQR
jgi:hypothetical protein